MSGGEPPTSSSTEPAIGEFKPIPGTMAEYEIGTELTGIFREPPAGLIVHYAGPVEDAVVSGSMWVARQNALDFFAGRAGEGITELVRRLTAPERDPDLSYQLMPVVKGAVAGPAARDFVLRGLAGANGAVLVRTPGAPLPPADTPGLVVAARLGAVDDEMLYEFFARKPREVPEGATIIRLHSLFTTESGIASLEAR